MSAQENHGRKDLLIPRKDGPVPKCSKGCSVCRGVLLRSLIENASQIMICFNKHVEMLLKNQIASARQRYFTFLRKKLQWKHATLTQERETQAVDPAISTKALGKILRKFNKIDCSIKGPEAKTKFQNLQLEDLKSPCLGELMAFNINVRERKNKTRTLPGQVEECMLQTSEGRPSLSITLSNSKVLAVDLTCSICLETLFDPVSLTCGHIFCYMCSCSAGSVNTVDGLKAANSKSKCPLCRKEGVFEGAVRMSQLNKLLRREFPEYWEERRQKERGARILEAKAYWEFQCRAFVGIN